MDETKEILQAIYKDSEMAAFSLQNLLEELKEKNNKIKETVTHILEGYKRYQKDATTYLEELNYPKIEEGKMAKMASRIGIRKEVKKDNSDSSIAEMLIQGISMGSLEMEQKLSQCEEKIDKKYYKFGKNFLEFQEDNIKALKKQL